VYEEHEDPIFRKRVIFIVKAVRASNPRKYFEGAHDQ
jgi:hypothetical protein